MAGISEAQKTVFLNAFQKLALQNAKKKIIMSFRPGVDGCASAFSIMQVPNKSPASAEKIMGHCTPKPWQIKELKIELIERLASQRITSHLSRP